MDWIVNNLGPWAWWIVAALLLIAELLVPAVFFLWLAVAALGVAVLALVADFNWQVEALIFCILSAVLVIVGRPIVLNRKMSETDQPHLNKRMYNYVGRSYVLDQPIERGRGKLKIEDALWTVNGPDAPAGTRIKVTDVDGLTLIVELDGTG